MHDIVFLFDALMNLKRKHMLVIVFLVAILLISAFGIRELISDKNLGGTGQSSQTLPSPSPQSSPSSSSAPTSSPSPSASPLPSPSPTSSPTVAEYTAQCQRDLNEAKAFDEKTRNVTLGDVNLVIVNQSWAIQTWGEGYAAPDIVEINRTERVYKGLFVIPENASLYQATVDWAGYFVSAVWNGQIYVVTENFNPWDPDAPSTFAHELTHIMQGLYYSNIPSISSTFDSDRARTALSEGDANYMQDLFRNATTTSSSPEPSAKSEPTLAWALINSPITAAVHPSLPNSISDFDYFPYSFGPDYINALYEKGGWATVDQAYSNPPNTTQQILQPQEYFNGIDAQPVQAPTLSEQGWTQEKTDRYGEYFIQVMLSNWIPQNQAQTAAASWSGDKMTYYEKGNDYLFTWKIQWNSTSTASTFDSSFQAMMKATNATKENRNDWYANGRYLNLEWDPTSNSTVIVGSSNETSALQSLTG